MIAANNNFYRAIFNQQPYIFIYLYYYIFI